MNGIIKKKLCLGLTVALAFGGGSNVHTRCTCRRLG